jgi:hypothetical protein
MEILYILNRWVEDKRRGFAVFLASDTREEISVLFGSLSTSYLVCPSK